MSLAFTMHHNYPYYEFMETSDARGNGGGPPVHSRHYFLPPGKLGAVGPRPRCGPGRLRRPAGYEGSQQTPSLLDRLAGVSSVGGCGRLPVIARSCPGSRLYLGR